MSNFTDLQEAFVLVFYNPLMWLLFFAMLASLLGGVHIAFYAAYKYFAKGRR